MGIQTSEDIVVFGDCAFGVNPWNNNNASLKKRGIGSARATLDIFSIAPSTEYGDYRE